jgi:hypothetical protein
VIKLGSNLIIKSGFGAAFLGAAQPDLMIDIFEAVKWSVPVCTVNLPACTVNLPVCTFMVSVILGEVNVDKREWALLITILTMFL